MTFWVYMLRCSDGSFYIGHTDDLERRIAEHQAGEIPGYTHKRRPVSLAWSQEFPSRLEALAAERQIKGWTRRKKEALARADWADLHVAAMPSGERALRLRSGRTEEIGSPRTVGPAPPLIVLVRPQLGENIGKAARAMLNFGLTELRLVAPRDGWPNPAAGPAAAGADAVLERATVHGTLADAIADCAHVYATTVRPRGLVKPVLTPEAAAEEMRGQAGRSAILFGPERSGLETEDVAVARAIVTVPVNPEFGSLNLAQAVILVAYEWSRSRSAVQTVRVDREPPADQAELDGMIAQLDQMLEGAGFFFPPDRTPTTRRTLRTMLTKPGWSGQEVRVLRGVLSALDRPRPRRGS